MSLDMFRKQRGSISLMGAMAMVASFSGFYMVLELGNKMVEDRNYTNYAKSMAPVALRTELAITQKMIEEGTAKSSKSVVQSYLSQMKLEDGSNMTLTLTFGNMEGEDEPEFVPLKKLPHNPKLGVKATEEPEVFSAVKVEMVGKGGLLSYQPKGEAIYGMSPDGRDDSNISACFCDVRYEACMKADTGNYGSQMGSVGSEKRKTYCEYGFAPVDKGWFFSQHKRYKSVDLSPQWVGKPFEDNELGVASDQSSTYWKRMQDNQPLELSNGGNVFPEASWDPAKTKWKVPGQDIMAVKNSGGTEKAKGLFYVGRTATCAHPKNFFFFDLFANFGKLFGTNSDCLLYAGDVSYKRDYPKVLQSIMSSIINASGANQYYYSCRDFTGIRSARAGFIQWFTRFWTSPFVDWSRAYDETGCVTRKMRWYEPMRRL